MSKNNGNKMDRWTNQFLQGINQSKLKIIAHKLYETIHENFETKLADLKSGITPITSINQIEFPDIVWQTSLDEKTERIYLKQIAKTLDILASTPIGKNVLSTIYPRTRFAVAPIQQTGRYINQNTPYVFVKPTPELLKNPKLLLQILVHECTHAKNREAAESTLAFVLPPRLFFMHQMMNEMTAYLNEQVVLAQLKNPQETVESVITDKHVEDILAKLTQKSTTQKFAQSLIHRQGNKILTADKNPITEQELKMFAYYIKVCPKLNNHQTISTLNQLYDKHVISVIANQKQATPQHISRERD